VATTDSSHDFLRYPNLIEGLEVTRPDQVWVADITHVRLREEFVYPAVPMNVFTRRIRGWELVRNLDRVSPGRP
jgi:transposase InsO family protein